MLVGSPRVFDRADDLMRPVMDGEVGMERKTSGESGLARALRIIEAFTSEQTTLTVAEIARRADLPVSTTYRLVGEMLSHGVLTKAEDGYVLGMRLWELATRGSKTVGLSRAARPYIEDLQHTFGQHAQLAVLEGTDVLYVDRRSAERGAVVNIIDVASRLPARLSSSGMVLAAYADYVTQRRILSSPVEQLTANTPIEPERLKLLWAEIRRQGFCRADGWMEDDVSSVASPVRDMSGVVAAVSLFLPNDGKAPRAAIPAVQMAAAGISRALGWRPSQHPR
ncbi:IclR family transcriptional regulator [Arthrobacter sp. NPDC089319]|uniref:IclR family transcriptional regulator n=1 Tax=Arthrobacter sp. NPDC089319 TaxID=3155915 RepID=UPI00343CFCE4